jgi:hypothetical protein
MEKNYSDKKAERKVNVYQSIVGDLSEGIDFKVEEGLVDVSEGKNNIEVIMGFYSPKNKR